VLALKDIAEIHKDQIPRKYKDKIKSKNKYDHSIDDFLLECLKKKDEQFGFNDLFKEISKKKQGISKTTLKRHLEKMREQSIIEYHKKRRYWLGRGDNSILIKDKGRFELTPWANFLLKNKISPTIRPNKQSISYERNKEELKFKHAIRLLLLESSRGYFSEGRKNVSSDGQIFISEPYVRTEGILVNDIGKNRIADSKFMYLDFTNEEIENYVQKLINFDYNILWQTDGIYDNEKSRIQLHFKWLKDFVSDWSTIIDEIRNKMIFTWNHSKKKIPDKQLKWFIYVYGKKELDQILNEVTKEGSTIKRNYYNEETNNYHQTINRLIRNLENNDEIKSQYLYLDNLLMEVVYPA
jgi:hypothetical protein